MQQINSKIYCTVLILPREKLKSIFAADSTCVYSLIGSFTHAYVAVNASVVKIATIERSRSLPT